MSFDLKPKPDFKQEKIIEKLIAYNQEACKKLLKLRGELYYLLTKNPMALADAEIETKKVKNYPTDNLHETLEKLRLEISLIAIFLIMDGKEKETRTLFRKNTAEISKLKRTYEKAIIEITGGSATT